MKGSASYKARAVSRHAKNLSWTATTTTVSTLFLTSPKAQAPFDMDYGRPITLKRELSYVDSSSLEGYGDDQNRKRTRTFTRSCTSSFPLQPPVDTSNLSCDRHERRRVNPEALALRLGPELVKELDALITPGMIEMPPFSARRQIQERFKVDRRHIYDYYHAKGLRVLKDADKATPMKDTAGLAFDVRCCSSALSSATLTTGIYRPEVFTIFVPFVARLLGGWQPSEMLRSISLLPARPGKILVLVFPCHNLSITRSRLQAQHRRALALTSAFFLTQAMCTALPTPTFIENSSMLREMTLACRNHLTSMQ